MNNLADACRARGTTTVLVVGNMWHSDTNCGSSCVVSWPSFHRESSNYTVSVGVFNSYPQVIHTVGLERLPRGSDRVVTVILLDSAREFGHLVVDRAALFHELADLLVGVHDRGVIAVAEQLPDLRQREVCHFSAQVHGDLTSGRDGLRA